MGNRYKKEEMTHVENLVLEGLTNRQIALKLGRSEQAIRNLRYRLKLKTHTEDTIRSLTQSKKELETEVNKLVKNKNCLTSVIDVLEKKKRQIVNSNETLMKKQIEETLVELKIEKPELFHITGQDQIAILVGRILKLVF